MIRALLIAGALVAMVALFVRLSPIGQPGAGGRDEEREPLTDGGVAAEPVPGFATRPTQADPNALAANLPDRDATPGGFTRGQQADGAVVRLPPRPPLSPPANAADEADDEPRATRHVLLPRPVAVDAAHLTIGKGTIVVSGIAPLALERSCGAGTGAWPCGMRARTAVRGYLRSRSIRCEVPENFGESRETVETACTLRGADIGDWIVRNGWAEAIAGGPYEDAEAAARQKRRGIWR